MNLAKLQSRVGAAETLLKAMASEPRLLILCELAGGERTVTELQQAVGIAMSAVSQHLAKLREAEIVDDATRVANHPLFARQRARRWRCWVRSTASFCVKRGPAESQKEKSIMTLDRAVLAFAGSVVLISLALGNWVSPWWLLLTAFAGLNMIQASFTGFCPAAMVFKAVGVKKGCAFE